jgi:hypothetical protein
MPNAIQQVSGQPAVFVTITHTDGTVDHGLVFPPAGQTTGDGFQTALLLAASGELDLVLTLDADSEASTQPNATAGSQATAPVQPPTRNDRLAYNSQIRDWLRSKGRNIAVNGRLSDRDIHAYHQETRIPVPDWMQPRLANSRAVTKAIADRRATAGK